MGATGSTIASGKGVDDIISKPSDGSDLKTLEQAVAEVVNLRRFAKEMKAMVDGPKPASRNREAIMAVIDFQKAETYVAKKIEKEQKVWDLIKTAVSTSILFSSCPDEEQDAIVEAFDQETHGGDTNIITQGEMGEKFYVVQSGTLDVQVRGASGSNTSSKSLGAGACFGELALMYNTSRAATIRTNGECIIWSIDRATYRMISHHHKQLRTKKYAALLADVVVEGKKFGGAGGLMTNEDLERMLIAMDVEKFSDGEVIIRQGNKGDHFYILADGKVKVHQLKEGDQPGSLGDQIIVLEKGAYFGERSLAEEEVRSASCVASGECTCLSISRFDFVEMYGSLAALIRGEKAKESKTEDISQAAKTKSTKISLEDLQMTITLGCGAFGRVKLAKTADDKLYAVKCQSKVSIVQQKLQDHVLNEAAIMQRLDHPFIVQLYATLQDDKYFYMVLELLSGGELFSYLRSQQRIEEDAVKFYAGIVVHAFITLHSRKIAYRDLKPENLIFDTRGYIKLVDLGLAKQVRVGKTWTMCGTPDYIAPEIILNEGHDMAVDYWTLGVLIYELFAGVPPFMADDPMRIYENILKCQYKMPNKISRNMASIIKKLLVTQQTKRLGNTRGGPVAILKHKWFIAFDWASLESGQSKTPYVPTLKSPTDMSNFDTFDDEVPPDSSSWTPDLDSL
jgi:CRP-like cAMP-binding protein